MNPAEKAAAILDLRNKRAEYINIGPDSRKVEIDRLRADIEDAKLNATADERFLNEVMEEG